MIMHLLRKLLVRGAAKSPSLRQWSGSSTRLYINASFPFLLSRPRLPMLLSSRTYEAEHLVNKLPKLQKIRTLEVSGIDKDHPVRKTSPSVKITGVAMSHKTGMLEVSWKEGKTDIFPYVWLRDNCLCPACFHAASNSRVHPIKDLDLSTQPQTLQVLEEGKQLEIVWTDGHRAVYPAAWLYSHAFNETQRLAQARKFRLNRSYWGAELLKNLPQASFHELLIDDSALLSWLQQLEIMGFVLVTGAPAEPGQVRRLAERVAFIKKTHYGEEFTVKAKSDPSNVAYLSGTLQLHADLPYYEYKPGVQFIHCVVQYEGTGGESLLADAVHVAHQLKTLYPEKYSILTQTPVDWFDKGVDELGEFYKILQIPMICTNATGEIQRINFSQPQRNSFFSIPAHQVAGWYDAMVTYHRLLSDPSYCLQFKMEPGNILTLDNLRVVHGRTSYISGPGERHVEGCYLDWDEVRSRRRVLELHLEAVSQD